MNIRQVAIILIFAATACGDGNSQFKKFVEGHKTGRSADYWLKLNNLSGEWERVALVHGYFDDYEGCLGIPEALSEKYSRRYRCTKAN